MRTGRGLIVALALTGAVTLAGFAALSLARDGTQTTSARVTVPGYDGSSDFPTKAASVSCPKGYAPQSGGFVTSADPEPMSGKALIIPQSMELSGRSLDVVAPNEGSSPGKAKAIEVCSRHAPDLVAVTKKGSVSTEDRATATATCPKGTQVLSGGFDGGTFTPDDGGAFVYGSRRTTKRDWTVYAESPGATGSFKFSATAYCGKGPDVKTASKTVTVPVGKRGKATAKCPEHTKVLFGSAVGDVNPATQTKAMFPNVSHASRQSGWSAGAANYDFDGSQVAAKLKAYAYCG